MIYHDPFWHWKRPYDYSYIHTPGRRSTFYPLWLSTLLHCQCWDTAPIKSTLESGYLAEGCFLTEFTGLVRRNPAGNHWSLRVSECIKPVQIISHIGPACKNLPNKYEMVSATGPTYVFSGPFVIFVSGIRKHYATML